MNIDRLLANAKGQTDTDTLGMILSNRIDMGSSEGGFISGAQFGALIEDIKTWRAWADSEQRPIEPAAPSV